MARPRPTPAGDAERLQKYLAQRGLGSRRARRRMDSRAAASRSTGASPSSARRSRRPTTSGSTAAPIKTRASAAAQVFIFNRSPGDPLREGDGERSALIDRLPKAAGRRFVAVSPMPGIDGGLELVTSDGALAAKLQRANHKLPCEFSVRVKGRARPRSASRA